MLQEKVSQAKITTLRTIYYIIRRNNHVTGIGTDGRSFLSLIFLKQNTLAAPDTEHTWSDPRFDAPLPTFRG
jgi:hypothetical protein